MKQNATRRQRRRVDREQARQQRRTRRHEFWAGISSRRALIATSIAATLSIGVAIPAQLQWFLGQLTDGQWVFPEAAVAVAATLLIEGLCWLGAFLYADSIAHTPVRLYRATTFLFAGIAAAINYAHGSATDPKVGVVYAVASLMGVGAWELYMHRTRHVATGMDLVEIRLWALRWRRHPRVMREVGRIRATHGLAVSRETAWRMAYLRKIGNPTVPVAVTSALVARLIGNSSSPNQAPTGEPNTEHAMEAEPTASSPKTEPGLGVDVLEHPVAWADATDTDAVLERFWVEPETEQSLTAGSTPTPTGTSPRVPRAKTPEQGVTSTVPGRKRNQILAGKGTSGIRFTPTKTELAGTGDAKERMLRYLARAELKGNSTYALDRNYIAEQFHVTTRHVRKTIDAYNESKGT